ncbi:hypothetical protein DV515_00008089 [Chloebia gouldiae]|uniref:Uncharacterized protein n=1 Tax=Chloebia gouldiae TaxID=44316 RepID=A0A3L8SG87_CHLGU|nr:hypothetical protein DV515_00008089 [Chloebia gouldiae]
MTRVLPWCGEESHQSKNWKPGNTIVQETEMWRDLIQRENSTINPIAFARPDRKIRGAIINFSLVHFTCIHNS